MNLRDELLKNHTKELMQRIVRYIGNDEKRFNLLMNLFLSNEDIISQRASWAVSHCADVRPQFIIPYLEKMLDNMENPVHDAVKRNTIRVLQFIDIPKKLQGKVADICFRFLCSNDETIAVKVFSMTVLHSLCRHYPELKNELSIAIEEQMPFASAAFISRGKKIMKSISKY